LKKIHKTALFEQNLLRSWQFTGLECKLSTYNFKYSVHSCLVNSYLTKKWFDGFVFGDRVTSNTRAKEAEVAQFAESPRPFLEHSLHRTLPLMEVLLQISRRRSLWISYKFSYSQYHFSITVSNCSEMKVSAGMCYRFYTL